MKPPQNTGLVLRLALLVAASAGYLCASSWLILINKHILSTLDFRYPMTLSGLGQVFSGAMAFLIVKVFRLVEEKQTVSAHTFVTKIFPVGFLTATTLYLGNMAYIYLSVSLIQMLKACCPAMVMVTLFAFGLEKPSARLIGSVVLITLGTTMPSLALVAIMAIAWGVWWMPARLDCMHRDIAQEAVANLSRSGQEQAGYGDISATLVGLAIMLLSELAEAVRMAITQVMLTGMSFQPMEGLMWLGSSGAAWMMMGSLVLEVPSMRANNAFDKIAEKPWLFAASGSMGFVVSLISLLIIQTASSLTLKVLGTVRNAGLVLFCVAFLGEIVTNFQIETWTKAIARMQGIGYTVSLIGFVWYNWIKYEQAKAMAKKPQNPGESKVTDKLSDADGEDSIDAYRAAEACESLLASSSDGSTPVSTPLAHTRAPTYFTAQRPEVLSRVKANNQS